MTKDAPGHNSAYISLNLLDELDYCLGGYGKPNVEFLFTLNTFVETFIASSEFYTSLDELNHLSLTASALFPNGRPILNLVAREGGLKFVDGVVNNPAVEVYRGLTPDNDKKAAQRSFILDYGNIIQERYFIQSNVDNIIDRIPLITSKFENDEFVVSEVLSTSNELISNLLNVCSTTSIQTTLPVYLYERQLNPLPSTPYSVQSLRKIAQLHEASLDELMASLNYQYLPIPPFTNILLSQVSSVSEIPQKLTQLRADFQDLRDRFVELERDVHEAKSIKRQIEAFNKFKDFWITFNRRYTNKKHRILYGSIDLGAGGDVDKGFDSLIDGDDATKALKDLNAGKIAGNILSRIYSRNNDRRVINRFKGLTNIWELFQDSTSINQQLKHVEQLFSVSFSNSDIGRVQQFVQTRIKDITKEIR